MCGIAGILSLQADGALPGQLKSMTDALVHRGPEGEGFWTAPGSPVHLGHRRLCIIDLSAAGAQPMHYPGRYTIVYNGEIYNYKEIRKDLIQKGFPFHTQTDTEVILAAYACYGEACLQHFDGMFAFAIWNSDQQTLFAARDRFGEKPFFYHRTRDRLYFASELKALWCAGLPRRVNQKMLYNYLTLGYTTNPADGAETFFDGVYKLPAASCLQYHLPSGRLAIRPYWTLATSAETPAARTHSPAGMHKAAAPLTARREEEITEQFTNLLNTAVARRLRSDVPVGTSLSGGLDSSSIAAVMKQLLDVAGNSPSIKTFSAVFPGYEKDESVFIRSVQERLGVQNYQTQPTADGMLQQFELLCYYQDEPFISASIYAQFCVFALAKKEGVTVLLDGQGADETLAGYLKYYHWYWQELYVNERQTFFKELQLARNAGITNAWNWKNKLAARFPHMAATLQMAGRKRQQQKNGDLQADFIRNYGRSYYTMPLPHKLENVLHFNTCSSGLEELLRYADRNSMAHGREVRLPFLSHELVEFVFSVPARFKIRDAWTKWLLRKSMSNKLPQDIVWRTGKIGFEPPQKQWMETGLLQDKIYSEKEKLVKAGILQIGVLKKTTKPQDALAAFNSDWRYLAAGKLF